MRKVKGILEGSKVSHYLNDTYVDDNRLLLRLFKDGECYNKETRMVELREEWKTGLESTEDLRRHTQAQILLIINNIYPCLQFTLESQFEFETGRLPTLDIEIWLDEYNNIQYSFYRKKIAMFTESLKEHLKTQPSVNLRFCAVLHG